MQYDTTKERIWADCLRFCELTGEQPARLCRKATGDGRMIDRLSGAGTVTIDKMDELYRYMTAICPSIINPTLESNHEDQDQRKSPKARSKEQASA